MASLYDIQQEIFNYLYDKPADATVLNSKAQNELSIYRTLVLNGAEALLESIYPHCYRILADNWESIIESYTANYPSRSPIYNHQAQKFSEFLASETFTANYNYPNYLAELALYEWTELELHNALDLPPLSHHLTPINKILELKYPITQVIEYLKTTGDSIEEIRSTDIEEESEIIFLYRDQESCKTRFFKLSETTLFVLRSLEAELSSKAIHDQFCKSFNIDLSLEAIETLLKELKNIGILLE